jgi:ornithine carbamoyltransferase
VTLRHFLTTQDWSRAELDALLAQAADYKREPIGRALEGKSIALLFFNSSLRTRTSFELGAHQLGGMAIVLTPGKDAWSIEFEAGAVMDGEPEEHVAEVARVLSRYVDLIGVRAFPKFQDWTVDRKDTVLRAFARYATVPVINLETITHPCQELAHMLTLAEHFGTTDPRKEICAHLDLPPEAAEQRGSQLGPAHRYPLWHGRYFAVSDTGIPARSVLPRDGSTQRCRERRLAAHWLRHRASLPWRPRSLR